MDPKPLAALLAKKREGPQPEEKPEEKTECQEMDDEEKKIETRDAESLVAGRPGETTSDAVMVPVGGEDIPLLEVPVIPMIPAAATTITPMPGVLTFEAPGAPAGKPGNIICRRGAQPMEGAIAHQFSLHRGSPDKATEAKRLKTEVVAITLLVPPEDPFENLELPDAILNIDDDLWLEDMADEIDVCTGLSMAAIAADKQKELGRLGPDNGVQCLCAAAARGHQAAGHRAYQHHMGDAGQRR